MQEKAEEAGHGADESRIARTWCRRKQERQVMLEAKEEEAGHGAGESRRGWSRWR